MDDPHAHIVISFERFSEWRARRHLTDANLTPPEPPPTTDAGLPPLPHDPPPVPHDPPQPEATARRRI